MDRAVVLPLTVSERLEVQPLCVRAAVQLVVGQLAADLALLAGFLPALREEAKEEVTMRSKT